ncbi:hypothetical protein GQ42DRAFT_9516 [Ramicandelaber brevisporus]|nr:hypothetical protein GQ42DRAFT_9516 [Ramicandelaber brevisporus]
MNVQAYFRLFDLPGELVEDISFFFFHRCQAHKLLTVSRAFHDLFSRRVWWELKRRMYTLSEPTRSIALARYGNLVRYIDLNVEMCSAIQPDINSSVNIYEILSVFSSVTRLRISDNSKLMSTRIQYKDIIMCFPKLYKLDCGVDKDNEPYDLINLADAINHRHSNRSMNPIEFLSVRYSVSSTDNPWARLSKIVQVVWHNRMVKVGIHPSSTTTTIPSQSELHILCRYFTKSPDIAKQREETKFCYTALNHSLYWRHLDQSNSCAYPQLRQLYIQTCCMSPNTYDYRDIAPINFPCLDLIWIKGHKCHNMISNSYTSAWRRVLLQNWPRLKRLDLSVNMTYRRLVGVLEYNRRLIGLHINLQPRLLDENNAFNLATILPWLPKLRTLSIDGKNGTKVDYSPAYNDYEILARSQIYFIQISGLHLSSRMFNFLFSLLKLNKISILYCQFYSAGVTEVTDMDNLIGYPNEIDGTDDMNNDGADDHDDSTYEELMATLDTISTRNLFNNPCGIIEFNLSFREDNDWPLDFTLEMMALMPRIRTFNFIGATKDMSKAVAARFPNTRVTYRRP